ncbi:MAG: sodium:proton antiporter NhaD [Agitococcus sp.]|jgi:NhaD family Na+/H+ antiporter|nr:sodium:proton antiporter NhaD [Moraxellaceae bacterium]MBK9185037.1 sodium:proton antiporter NhaD [Moraxellaceae bacterium]MBP9215893.1 sodium:proton antiporter NhaD [Agitococcus sp.]MCC6373822.1 sodium:proton antiporter NhaD [Moraxellaceae bacterium]HQV80623.1 sodium:proton antiporter NhaD [Agitococcus sp.]
MLKVLLGCASLALPSLSYASSSSQNFTNHPIGFTVLAIFIFSYICVIFEEQTHIKKSLPVMLGAGLIWIVIAVNWHGDTHAVEQAVKHYLLEYAELLLFLLAAMTYVNALSERGIFEALRVWLIGKGFNYRTLFWITGFCAFFLSPILDNLTTALVLCAVLLAVGKDNPKFISLGAINIVVAANAGGAFSPFGDITTLMVWQKGLVEFGKFFALFLPSLVNFVVPAFCMSFAISTQTPPATKEGSPLKRGAWAVLGLFMVTIAMAVSFHSFLNLPPFLGMMTGLALLKFYGYYLSKTHQARDTDTSQYGQVGDIGAFDSFKFVAQAEWDTLLFFFGVIMCVGGLGFVGYLELASHLLYNDLGATTANILIGMLSAVVDNIPIMVAVLQMQPQMDIGQWLLVTLTAGVGGSLLSVGSAAGVAMMGQAKGYYTFFSHLKWSWAIALGYGLSIACHFFINKALFTG